MNDKKTTNEHTPESIKVVQVFAAQAVMVAELTNVPLAHLGHFLLYWAQKQDAMEQCLETVRAKGVSRAKVLVARSKTPEETMEEWRAEIVTEQSAALAILDDIMITAETFDPMYRKPHLAQIK